MEVDYEILGIRVSKELYDNIKQEVEKFGSLQEVMVYIWEQHFMLHEHDNMRFLSDLVMKDKKLNPLAWQKRAHFNLQMNYCNTLDLYLLDLQNKV